MFIKKLRTLDAPFVNTQQFSDLRQRMVEGTGFEPVYAKRSDLQSDGFNHSPTPPRHRWAENEAPGRVVGAVYGGLMTVCQHPFGKA